MRRTAVVLVLALSLLAGCGLSSERAPRLLEVQDLGGTPSERPAVPPGARSTTLYLVRDNALAPVTRRTAASGSPNTALQLLLRGPTTGESTQGLSTALGPDAVLLNRLTTSDNTVVVPLAGVPAGLGRSDEVLAYAQIVTTLTSLRDVSAVRFTRDGAALAVPRADGSLTGGPLSRRDYADLL